MFPCLVLAAATAMEMRAVIRGLGLALPVPDIGSGITAAVGVFPVRLIVCGIGPLAAAFAAGRLAGEGALSPATCRGLLSLGIAGSYDAAAAPVGSVVLASREIWPEYGLVTERGVDAEALGFPLAGKKDDADPPPVWNSLPLDPAAALAAMGLRDFRPASRVRNDGPESGSDGFFATAGPSVTVAGVSATAVRAADLAVRHAALTENMEGFPLALAARQAGVPFAEIRSVSNVTGDRSAAAWDIPAALDALALAVAALFPA